MQILTHVQQNSYIIALSGSMNPVNAPHVQYILLDALQYKPKEIMVDCEELEEISTQSLKPFISTVRYIQQNHVGLVLINVNEKLNGLFMGLGVDIFMNRIASSSIAGPSGIYDIYFRQI